MSTDKLFEITESEFKKLNRYKSLTEDKENHIWCMWWGVFWSLVTLICLINVTDSTYWGFFVFFVVNIAIILGNLISYFRLPKVFRFILSQTPEGLAIKNIKKTVRSCYDSEILRKSKKTCAEIYTSALYKYCMILPDVEEELEFNQTNQEKINLIHKIEAYKELFVEN